MPKRTPVATEEPVETTVVQEEKPKEKQKKASVDYSKNRRVLYQDLVVKKCTGKDALSVEKVKTLLGWVEVEDENDEDYNAELSEVFGRKIRTMNNNINRFFTPRHIEDLCQEVLTQMWRVNGETIVIGVTGEVLSGQHRLVALILAYERWLEGDQSKHWKEVWKDQEPNLPCIIVFGIDESDDTFKTLNRGKPATFQEFLYRSKILEDVSKTDKKRVGKMAEFASRFIWSRTDFSIDEFAPRFTLSEAENFVRRHPKLLDACQHVMKENVENCIGKHIAVGTASGLLFLMATMDTDREKYRDKPSHERSEKLLDFKCWERACLFWSLLGSSTRDFDLVRRALAALNDTETGMGATVAEKVGTLIKAWKLFIEEEPFELSKLKLTYKENNGDKTLAEFPSIGGIDLGNARGVKKDEDDAKKPVASPTSKKKGKTLQEQHEEFKAKYPGRLLLFKVGTGYQAWGTEDCKSMQSFVGLKPADKNGWKFCSFGEVALQEVMGHLMDHGVNVTLIEKAPEGSEEPFKVELVDAPQKKAATQKKAPAAKGTPTKAPAKALAGKATPAAKK